MRPAREAWTEHPSNVERTVHCRGLLRLTPAVDRVHLARATEALRWWHARCREDVGVVVDPDELVGSPPALLRRAGDRWARLTPRAEDDELAS